MGNSSKKPKAASTTGAAATTASTSSTGGRGASLAIRREVTNGNTKLPINGAGSGGGMKSSFGAEGATAASSSSSIWSGNSNGIPDAPPLPLVNAHNINENDIKRLVAEEQVALGKDVLLEIRSALFPYEVVNIIIAYCGTRADHLGSIRNNGLVLRSVETHDRSLPCISWNPAAPPPQLPVPQLPVSRAVRMQTPSWWRPHRQQQQQQQQSSSTSTASRSSSSSSSLSASSSSSRAANMMTPYVRADGMTDVQYRRQRDKMEKKEAGEDCLLELKFVIFPNVVVDMIISYVGTSSANLMASIRAGHQLTRVYSSTIAPPSQTQESESWTRMLQFGGIIRTGYIHNDNDDDDENVNDDWD